ncbi:MAG: hypothetical protein WBQ21_04355, partial [Solirubrobacteraceae bacterium]
VSPAVSGAQQAPSSVTAEASATTAAAAEPVVVSATAPALEESHEAERAPEESEPRPAVAVAEAPLPGDLDALWPAVHESVRAEHELLGAVLSEAVPAMLTDEELVLAFPPTAAFHKRKAEDPDNRTMLIDTLRRLSGRRYRVAFELREDLPSSEGPGGRVPTEEEVMARLMAELDAEELPEDWLTQQKGE